MDAISIINTIQKYSLTARCLPHEVVSLWTYREGDEVRCKKPVYDSEGNIKDVKRTIIFDENRGRKMLREVRRVNNGGWWYVKHTPNTNSTVRFSRKYDKFFAPTLGEAIQLYLNSIK